MTRDGALTRDQAGGRSTVAGAGSASQAFPGSDHVPKASAFIGGLPCYRAYGAGMAREYEDGSAAFKSFAVEANASGHIK